MSNKKPLAQYGGTIEQIQSGDFVDPTLITINVASKSSNYVMTSSDDVILASGTTTITLPDATTCTKKKYTIKKTDSANTLTINTPGSQTIDGQLTLSITIQYTAVEVVPDGSNFDIV